tara:strand:+ start:3077 stop:4141 length:1065 start_codon:yes stop_codon:yes gene_type:complete
MNNKWDSSTKYTVIIILSLFIIWIVWMGRSLISPIIIAALLAFTLNPMISWLCDKSRMSHTLAVIIVYSLLTIILIAIPVIAAPYLIRQLAGFSETVIGFLNSPGIPLSWSFSIGDIILSPSNWITNIDQFIAESIDTEDIDDIAGNALDFIAAFTNNMLWVLITLVTLFYLLKDGKKLKYNLLNLAPPKLKLEWEQLMEDIDNVWGAFLRGQLLLMLIVGVLAGLGGIAIGLPGAVILGVLAGLLDIVPSLGPTASGLIAVIVGLILGSTYMDIPNPWFGLIVAALYFLVQQIENIWLRPQIMSTRLNLHPGLIFVGVIAALATGGILAGLLIVPLMATASILGKYFYYKLTE